MAALATIADIAGTGSAVALAAKSTFAKWVAVSALVHDARVGDANVTGTRGVNVSATAPGPVLVCPPLSDVSNMYDLSKIFCVIANGGSLTVTYGV